MQISSITASTPIKTLPFWGVLSPAPQALPAHLAPISGKDLYAPADFTLPLLGRSTYKLIHTQPMAKFAPEVDLFTRMALARGAVNCMNRQARAFGLGLVSYPRLEALMQLLLHTLGPSAASEPLVVDNGPRTLTHVAMVAAKMGAIVLVKEPDANAVSEHRRITRRELPESFVGQIAYAQRAEEIDRRYEADLVFWTSPDPGMMDPRLLAERGFANADPYEYLGRDVRVGGILAIQTCDSEFYHHCFHPRRWEQLFASMIPEDDLIIPTRYVVPDMNPLGNYLVIMRRLRK